MIERYSTPQFKSLIEITPTNKNFVVFKKIDDILKREKKSWNWFLNNLDIPLTTVKTYFAGRENVSMMSMELMSKVLQPYIASPRILMNDDFPILTLGKEFKLNIDFIFVKYGITQGEVARYTSIDRSAVSLMARGKMKCLNPVGLIEIFEFMKDRGVPLKSACDLIYFPTWGEKPDHFVRHLPRRNQVFKYHGKYRFNSNE